MVLVDDEDDMTEMTDDEDDEPEFDSEEGYVAVPEGVVNSQRKTDDELFPE